MADLASLTVEEMLDAVSASADRVIAERNELRAALSDVIGALTGAYDLARTTGLPRERCEEICRLASRGVKL